MRLINTNKTPNLGLNSIDHTLNKDELRVNFLKLDSEMKERGTNVNWYKSSNDSDDTEAIKLAIQNTPSGGRLYFPVRETGDYIISEQIVIDRPIKLVGDWGRRKNLNISYGTVIRLAAEVNQSNLESFLLVNSSWVEIEGLSIKGQGYTKGSKGILFKSSHLTNVRKVLIEGFESGYFLGEGSDHVKAYDMQITGCYDGIVFGEKNQFDFSFVNCALDGNIHSSVRLVSNTSVDNVSFYSTHLGFSQYGIYQDPTTTGDGFACLSLRDSPIERVSLQHIKIISGGNIRIEGGYWHWDSNSPASPSFSIDAVTVGPIWFSPRLERTSPNSNSSAVIKINKYTNHNIYFDTPLNGFAQTKVINPNRQQNIFIDGQIAMADSVPTGGRWNKAFTIPNENVNVGTHWGWIITEGGSLDGTPWKANHRYGVNSIVYSNNNVYQSTLAGISGTSPITGTDSDIIDGSVKWRYVTSQAKAIPIGPIPYSVSDMVIPTSSKFDILSFIPTMKGNFDVKVYYRISGSQSANVAIDVSYFDGNTSLVTHRLVNVERRSVGSYVVTPIMINAISPHPIKVSVITDSINRVYVSAAIVPI